MKPLLQSLALLTLLTTGSIARADQVIYSDSLQSNWQNYGWATLNYSATSPVQSGSDSISVTAGAYQALYLHHDAQDSTPYKALTFWINGGLGGQTLQVQATLNGNAQTPYPIGPLAANTWTQVTIGLDTLSVANTSGFDGFWIQDTSGANSNPFYIDTVSLVSGTIVVPPPPPNSPVAITVNAASRVHAISPLIYGVAFATPAQLKDLNTPVNRMGGNSETRYNWQVNADNRAQDYYFESIADPSAVKGERGDTFIADNKASGVDTMLTIPLIPWIAKVGPNRDKLASFSVKKYGAQQSTDPYMPDAGNGVSSSGTPITGNDPKDACTPNSVAIQTNWVKHLVAKWGKGTPKYYLMDNEPSIWFSTHRDVAPIGLKMNDLKTSILAYSAAVKSVDPTALVVGPEEWGWGGYIYSGYDQQYGAQHGYSGYPDRAANGNMDYLPWLLKNLRSSDLKTKTKSLDVFSVHYYPQSGEFGNDTSTAMQLKRNETTRELWDPAYTAKNWINAKVELIPRIKGWVKSYYPGLQTAVTEYNWGAENHINGATTQADIFGIFGRESLDMATRWTTPDATTPTYLAMKMYRNVDGKNNGFGDTSIYALPPKPDELSSFAALRTSDGALTIMVVNKVLTGTTPVSLRLVHFTPGTKAQVWQLTSANAIKALPAATVTKSVLATTVPAQSVTLFVIPKA